jgi:hypothetical protein
LTVHAILYVLWGCRVREYYLSSQSVWLVFHCGPSSAYHSEPLVDGTSGGCHPINCIHCQYLEEGEELDLSPLHLDIRTSIAFCTQL